MSNDKRIAVALGLFLLLGVLALVGRSHYSAPAASGADALSVNVTSPEDLGPGSLREALFIVAAATGKANVLIKTRRIVLRTALPPLTNAHGVRIAAEQPGSEIDAQGLAGGPVLDIIGANTSLEGLVLRNCPAAAVQLRAVHFHLLSSAIVSCDVGVDVAANASDALIEHNRFANDRIGVRFAAPSRNTVVAGNSFVDAAGAGLWAVRGESDAGPAPISVQQNRFTGDHSGVVAGNIAILVERNDFAANAPDAAVHLVGAGAVIRANHISGAAAMGIVAENAREARIESNDFNHLSAYAIMVRGSADALVRANRVNDCGYGIAFVLGDAGHPSIAVENTIVEPKFDGIDIIGDSPVLRRNQVLRPHALALHVVDFHEAGGQNVRAQPLLEGNNFRANALQVASDNGPAPEAALRE
ncbi:MAG TPA: right-handed parallel beta-helix repeat-containing protein [Steroidobacteraceae bacterium]